MRLAVLAGDTVAQVIVVPDGLPDPVGYGATLGLKATVLACDAAAAIGMKHVEGRLYPIWRQVFGAGDDGLDNGYPAGTEVFHAGRVWVTPAGGNVWEPGVSGWHMKAGAWVAPTGAHDAYGMDVRVTHRGKVWRSLVAVNVWEPGTPGLWAEE